jgi:hypothetical protein
MILVEVAAAALLLLGSGLIFDALVRLDRESEAARPTARHPLTPDARAPRKLRRAA